MVVGYETNFVSDVDDLLKLAHEVGLEFVVIPLYHPRYRRDWRLSSVRTGPLTRSDLVLPSSDWISNIVGKVPDVSLYCVSPIT